MTTHPPSSGEAGGDHERGNPAYPGEAADRMLHRAEAVADVVDAGVGTGKFTASLAARDLTHALGSAEQDRLESCVREPIRRPGSIQSHGMMLAVDRATWPIVQSSENTDALVGCSAEELLGTSLAELIGDDAVGQLSAVLRGELTAANPTPVMLKAARRSRGRRVRARAAAETVQFGISGVRRDEPPGNTVDS